MSIPILVDSSKIDEALLKRFLTDVSALTGVAVTVTTRIQWEVTCNNYPVSLALQTLIGNAGQGVEDARKKTKPTAKQADFALTKKGKAAAEAYAVAKATVEPPPPAPLPKAPAQAVKAWRLLDADGNVVETLSTEERNRRLALGAFAEGAVLHHPKVGKQKITGFGPGQGMEPVK